MDYCPRKTSHLTQQVRSSITAEGGVERFYAAKAPEAVFVDSLDVRAEINKELSLEKEYPIRVLVSRHHLLVCMSHIICDYTTLDQLFEEFFAAYNHSNTIRALPPSRQGCYHDLNCWKIAVDEATARFWSSYLSGVDHSRKPPYMKKARVSHDGQSRMFQLSGNTMAGLKTISQSLHLTMHQISLAVVSIVLQVDCATKRDLILGSPYLGRQEEDMNTIGLFLQPLPIRVPRRSKGNYDLTSAPVVDFLLAVQDSARSALGHGLGWDSLMSVLSSSSDEKLRAVTGATSPNHPLFQAMVTFQERSTTTGKPSSLLNATISGVEPLITWADGAKFGIMFEFSAVSPSVVTLRIEYDTSVFSTDEVVAMVERIDTSLDYISQQLDTITVGDLEDVLLNNSPNVDTSSRVTGVEFGTRLAALV